jgi:DNA polymerase-3 subunit delta'
MESYYNQIAGQERVKTQLNGFLTSKKIPHALLFSGNEGVGKEFLAVRFAQALNESFPDKSASQKILKQIEQLSEPYIKFIFALPRGKNETDTSNPTEKLSADEIDLVREQIELKVQNPYHKITIPKANNIKINSIRDIKRFIALDYSELGYRVIIITDAHLMNEEAQNALLKNLEEPPEKVIFILITSQVSKLRRTIISRCWRINFDPLSEENISEIIINFFSVDKKLAEAVAPFAEGSVRTAMQLIELDFYNLQEKTISILRYSFGKKYNSAFEEMNSIFSNLSFEYFPVLIRMIITWLNDLQKHRFNMKTFFFKDHSETLEKFNTKFPDVELGEVISRVDRLSSLIRNNVNQSLLSANLVFELSSITSAK